MNSPVTATGALTADHFAALFTADTGAQGFARIARQADPTLAPAIAPCSFVTTDLLNHVSAALALRPDQLLIDLGCGSGGPGLWLAERARARLVGVDFCAEALIRARRRTADFAVGPRAHFALADLAATAVATAGADAAVSIDALQYPIDRYRVAAEARRILRPGGRLVLTGWHPYQPGDLRLPHRHRVTDWPAILRHTGFTRIAVATRPAWDQAYQATYRLALAHGDPGADLALASLQQEARQRLPTAYLLRRVTVTATAC